MAQKKNMPSSQPGLIRRLLIGAARRLLRPLLGADMEKKRTPERGKTRVPRETAEPEVRHEVTVGAATPVVPIEATEPAGPARDARSFEQRRRGGPVTGEVSMPEGPHHSGGGRTKGRDPVTKEILDSM